MPTPSWLSWSIASLSLVPTPSLAATSSGSAEPRRLQVEQAAEAAKIGIGAGPPGGFGEGAIARDQRVAGCDRDARLGIGIGLPVSLIACDLAHHPAWISTSASPKGRRNDLPPPCPPRFAVALMVAVTGGIARRAQGDECGRAAAGCRPATARAASRSAASMVDVTGKDRRCGAAPAAGASPSARAGRCCRSSSAAAGGLVSGRRARSDRHPASSSRMSRSARPAMSPGSASCSDRAGQARCSALPGGRCGRRRC